MSKPKPLTTKATAAAAVAETPGLLADLRQLIEQSRQAAALDKELLVIMSRHTKENKMGLDSCLFIIVPYSKYGL